LNEKSRGLGTLTILLEVQYALKRKINYYYLGHFYAHNPNYHYKTRFSGFELYDWDNDRWLDFRHSKTKELLKQKLPRRKD
jgi:arginyl-tRNA--protein-N-Asp/Glu arginylyltransferase